MLKASLFSEFPQVSAKQWKQKIQYDLKGADYNETLVWETLEGIQVKPFYHSEENNNTTFHDTKKLDWSITQPIYVGDAKKANEKAIDALARGAESLLFKIPESTIDWQVLFQNIDFNSTPAYFDFDGFNLASLQEFIRHTKDHQAPVFLNIDSIGKLVKTGNWYQNLDKDFESMQQLIQTTTEFDQITPLAVDLSHYQNAGANRVQQLAYGLAHANEYLNRFKEQFVSNKNQIVFKVAVGSNYFFEIAKIRALRWLWESMSEAYGSTAESHILAYPSKRNKTIYDYNTNLLRSTSECMAAVLGGADAICNLPYDGIYHKDNEFSDRIARNQLLLLKEESYFEGIENPAKGNYYIENITSQLAEKALALFKEIENAGGLLQQLKNGVIQKKIKEAAAKEQNLFNAGELVLVGTNKYENKADRMKSELELYPFLKKNPHKTLIEPIIPLRLAETLEQNRLDNE